MLRIAAVILLTMVLVVLIGMIRQHDSARIVSAHVINMDKSADRLAEFQQNALRGGLVVTRWPAVDGSRIGEADLVSLGLSKYIYKYSQEHKQPGLLGCFLSHRGLLRHLEKMRCGADDAHIIFEDDAYVPVDFMKEYNSVVRDLPADWDMVQLGVTFPNLRPYRGRLHRHLGDKGNVGGFAYMVRHGSLRKINTAVAVMYDPMDVMLRNQWKTWKMYILWPELCPHNDHGESIIVTKQ